mmetsp:Transcript_9836/g.20345  ORF Transcript_9836/g.20345 Transcript_9836/m.20345 type:complete len:84 (-) Transcript_9836:56-307(-)
MKEEWLHVKLMFDPGTFEQLQHAMSCIDGCLSNTASASTASDSLERAFRCTPSFDHPNKFDLLDGGPDEDEDLSSAHGASESS